jgi:hypothetical protein
VDLALHRVDGRGRVNLEGIVTPGTEFYMAARDDDGNIRLTPVKVVTTVAKRNHDDGPAVEDGPAA